MIYFQTAGVLTTIQDLGRWGYQHLGINPNGVMDGLVVRLLNTLLGNDENEGCIEMHFPAPEIHFKSDAIIALGGGDFSAHIHHKPVPNWKPIFVKKGEVLKFNKKVFGARAYLAMQGGLDTEKWLESVSTNLMANAGGKHIKKGDTINLKNRSQIAALYNNFSISPSLLPKYSNRPVLRMIAGNEYQNLAPESLLLFDQEYFSLTNDSNRMGFRLAGKPLHLMNNGTEILSTAVSRGTVQLLPNGQLIILMADHQTTGGYPRLGHIIAEDLSVLAQLNPFDSCKFQLIGLETAEMLLMNREKELKQLKNSIFYKTIL